MQLCIPTSSPSDNGDWWPRNWKEIEQKITFSLKDKTEPQCRLKFLISCSHPKIYNQRRPTNLDYGFLGPDILYFGRWLLTVQKNIPLRFWGLMKTGCFFEKSTITYQRALCHNSEGHNVKLRSQEYFKISLTQKYLLVRFMRWESLRLFVHQNIKWPESSYVIFLNLRLSNKLYLSLSTA